jgi:hypothetical protein
LSNWSGNDQGYPGGYNGPPYNYGAPPPPQPPPGKQETGLSVLLGLFLPGPLLLLQIPLFFITLAAIAVMGISHVLYILPLVFLFRRLGRPKLALGLIIGSSILFLLNATCLGWALVMNGVSHLTSSPG